MKKRTTKRKASGLKCECGGTLERVTLRDYDFSSYAGLVVRLADPPGLRCSACGRETLEGDIINLALLLVALNLAESPVRLSPEFARYLRRFLRVTQQELANRMGLARETIAKWECGETEISPTSDMILRVLVLSEIYDVDPEVLLRREGNPLRELSSVRTAPPRKGPKGALPHPVSIQKYVAQKPARVVAR